MSDTYIKLNVCTDVPDQWIALLSEYPFTGYEYTNDGFIAYALSEAWSANQRTEVLDRLESAGQVGDWQKVVNTNWNALWESQFEPVEIPDFCRVRATFHAPKEGFAHELLIHPRMTFGTGHHATTYMMMQLLEHYDCEGKQIFDFGCGTGILGILAKKLGATAVFGIDNDANAVENAQYNALVNDTIDVTFAHATIDELSAVPSYDLILANINRTVILESLPALQQLLYEGGDLLLSGVLASDGKMIESAAHESALVHVQTLEKDGWLAIHLRR